MREDWMRVVGHVAAGALAVVIYPALCFAQFGAIAGVVRDSSGAILPGVTVEAASPALIESIPPADISATLAVSSATAAASLGRPMTVPSVNVPLIEPSTMFGERVNQLDLRVSKGVRVGRYRVEAIADIYNAFNASTVLTQTATYGPIWLRPGTILQSAFVKLGGRLSF